MSVVVLNISQFSIQYIWKKLGRVFWVFSNSELYWEASITRFYGLVIFDNAEKVR